MARDNNPRNQNIGEDASFDTLSQAVSQMGKLSNMLSEMAGEFRKFSREFKGTSNGLSDKLKDIAEDEADEREKGYKNLTKDLEGWSRGEHKYIAATLNSLKSIFSYAIQKFTQGFNTVVNNYLDNFTDVVTRNYKSNSDYAEAMYRFTDWVSQKGLKVQFSQVDLNNQMLEALNVGVRGSLAETMAEQNVVTKRLMGYINTNTRAYTRMSKDLGQSFSDAVLSIGKYSEQMYGAMGLEENGFENVLDTIYREVGVAGVELGWSKDQIATKVMEVVNTYNRVFNTMGDAAAEEFLNSYKDVMTGNTSNILAMTLSQTGYANPTSLLSISADQFLNDFMDRYMQLAENSQQMSIFGNVLGGYNTKAAQDIFLYTKGLTKPVIDDETKSNVEYLTSDQWIKKISDGYGQSKTAQQTKWNENLMANAATYIASILPDVSGTLGLISGTIKNFFNAWLTKSAGEGLFGGAGKGGSGGLITKGVQKVFPNATTGSILLGGSEIALGAVGAYYGIKEGIIGGIADASNKSLYNREGVSSAKIAGGTLATAGGTTLAGVGAATLAGAAAGSAAIPVVGWIAAAALGLGALTIAVADATKKTNAFVGTLQEAESTTYDAILKETSARQDSLLQIKKQLQEGASLEESRQALLNLGIDESTLAYVNTSKTLSDVIDELVLAEERVAGIATEKASTGYENAIAEVYDQMDEEWRDNALASLVGYFNTVSPGYKDVESGSPEAAKLRFFVKTAADAMSEEAGDILIKGFEDALVSGGALSSGEWKMLMGSKGMAAQNKALWREFDLDNAFLDNLTNLEGFNTLVEKYQLGGKVVRSKDPNRIGKSPLLLDMSKVYATISSPDEYLEEARKEANSHALGLSAVPYDNYLANLHAGEAVLPASAAENLRYLSGSSISNMSKFLSTLAGIKSSATPVESNISYANLVVSAINNQTAVLSDLLESILVSVRDISGNNYNSYLVSYGD